MREKMKCLSTYLVLLSILLFAESCQRRDLFYEEKDLGYANIEVNIKWDKSKLTPEYATLLFYREGDAKPITYYTTKTTDIVKLPEGKYSIIVINEKPEDFDAIGFREMDNYNTIQAYVKPIPTDKSSIKSGAVPIQSADMLALSTLKTFVVTKEMIKNTLEGLMIKRKGLSKYAVEKLTFEPELVTINAELIIHIKGINNIRKETSQGSLSGFAESIYLHSGKPTPIPGICYFDLTEFTLEAGSTTVGSASGRVNIFGFSNSGTDNILTFSYNAILRDAARTPYSMSRDITSFVNQKPETSVSLLIEVGTDVESDPKNPIVVVPDVKPEDSGFIPSIPEWDDEEEINKIL